MHVRQANFSTFKRFTSLSISELPATARLIVLCGPNGLGKSSVFEGFRLWHAAHGIPFPGWDPSYYQKQGYPDISSWPNSVAVSFYEPEPVGEDAKRTFYIRSAYRHEAGFQVGSIGRPVPLRDAPRVGRLIEVDIKVSDNYQRLVSKAIGDIYTGLNDQLTVRELRERLLGPIGQSMRRLFPNLELTGTGDPIQSGTFYFTKDGQSNFQYQNLSGGEKAAFDIILDLIVKQEYFNDTVYCVDEPELHMNTRLQALLLEEMYRLMPDTCQLWIATHSIGMMRAARDLQQHNPTEIVFLDFEGRKFEEHVDLTPQTVTREFWARTLYTAFGDMASLIAPERIVLCEGSPRAASRRDKAEFDARCYRTIFGDRYPDTDFVSVGNSSDVSTDR